jgi:hypothetical protein
VADWFAGRNVMEGRAGIAGSFRLYARELDYLGAFLGFSRDRHDVADEIELRRWIPFDIPASLLTVFYQGSAQGGIHVHVHA